MIRQATGNDIPFLVEAILQADKGVSGKLSYEAIFHLSEKAFTSKLPEILEEDIEGQELCISGFMIAEEEGEAAAACCCWIEAPDQSSNALKTSILHHFFTPQELTLRPGVKEVIQAMHLHRTAGALQYESVYVHPRFRGKGLLAKLFSAQAERYPEATNAEIMLTSGNAAALRSYEKMQFLIREEKLSPNTLLPFEGMVMMKKEL